MSSAPVDKTAKEQSSDQQNMAIHMGHQRKRSEGYSAFLDVSYPVSSLAWSVNLLIFAFSSELPSFVLHSNAVRAFCRWCGDGFQHEAVKVRLRPRAPDPKFGWEWECVAVCHGGGEEAGYT
jgi:hypothetical protein